MDSPETWESLCATHFQIANGAAALNGTGPARKSLLRRSELRETGNGSGEANT
jgi:hypothetical protein